MKFATFYAQQIAFFWEYRKSRKYTVYASVKTWSENFLKEFSNLIDSLSPSIENESRSKFKHVVASSVTGLNLSSEQIQDPTFGVNPHHLKS